jgi:hypothetical protein
MSSIAMDGARVFYQTSMFQTTTITGSPALAAETIVATLVLPVVIRADQRVFLFGWSAYTVGTTGTNSIVRLRQTNVAGTIVASTGSLTTAAASLQSPCIVSTDAPGLQSAFTYVMTLQVTAATAASTLTAVSLIALVI